MDTIRSDLENCHRNKICFTCRKNERQGLNSALFYGMICGIQPASVQKYLPAMLFNALQVGLSGRPARQSPRAEVAQW